MRPTCVHSCRNSARRSGRAGVAGSATPPPSGAPSVSRRKLALDVFGGLERPLRRCMNIDIGSKQAPCLALERGIHVGDGAIEVAGDP